jgi:hypothetical protein
MMMEMKSPYISLQQSLCSKGPMHLLSPQHVAQQTTSVSDGFHSKGKYDILTVLGLHRTIHHNTSNNLLILFLASDFSSSSSTSNNNSATDTSHASLARQNITLLCKACIHGKQHRQAVTTNSAAGILDISHLKPGDCASGDQVESTTPALIPMYHGTMLVCSSLAMLVDNFILLPIILQAWQNILLNCLPCNIIDSLSATILIMVFLHPKFLFQLYSTKTVC